MAGWFPLFSTPATLPLPGNIVTHFDAATPALTNGATVSSWTDTVNGIVAGTQVGTLPTYSTNRLNGKPSVSFGGVGGLSIATPGAMKSAIDSLSFTVLVVFRSLGSASNGALLAANAGGTTTFYKADGSNVSWDNQGAFVFPYSGQSSFSTLGSTSNSAATYSSSGSLQAFYVNGGAVSSSVISSNGTGGNTLCIGDNNGNNFPVNAEIFDILVWNVPLTPPQYMQAQAWACNKYAQPYPWASLASFNVFFGDSITQGVGASSIVHQAPYLAAQTLGLSPGQWHNIAVGGITTANMDVLGPAWVDPIPAFIGKKTNLVGFEWHNENAAGAPPGPYNHAVTYLANRKAIANQRTVWGTSTSEIGDPIANRATYNSSFDSVHANVDSYVQIHLDSTIGVNGSYAANSSTGDGIHLTDTTYPALASLFVSGIQALP